MTKKQMICEDLHDAVDAETWKCQSCDKMIEDDHTKPYCRYCGEYWKDVQNGLWERPEYVFCDEVQ